MSLCCLPSPYDHCLRIRDSGQDVDDDQSHSDLHAQHSGQHEAVRYALNSFEMKLFQAHQKHLPTYGSAQDSTYPRHYEPKISFCAWDCTISYLFFNYWF